MKIIVRRVVSSQLSFSGWSSRKSIVAVDWNILSYPLSPHTTHSSRAETAAALCPVSSVQLRSRRGIIMWRYSVCAGVSAAAEVSSPQQRATAELEMVDYRSKPLPTPPEKVVATSWHPTHLPPTTRTLCLPTP